MTGLFIGEKVKGERNVIWNSDSFCEPCAIVSSNDHTNLNSNNDDDDDDDDRLSGLNVESWPNPSNHNLNVQVITEVNEEINIKVFDSNNRLVHFDNFSYDNIYKFGDNLQSGLYIVKITQGDQSKTIRFIKY